MTGALPDAERIRFRHLVPGDLDALFHLYGDPEIRRHFPDGVRTREETREELEWFRNGHPRRPELGLWATELKEDGTFLGRSGLLPWTIEGVEEVEIAYMVAKEHWRRGYGAEVARALVRHGFATLGLPRLIALIDPGHAASIRTAVSAGLAFEKRVVMDGVASDVYAVLNSTR